MAERDKNDRRELRRAMRVLSISFVMALAILAGWLLGWFLDSRVTGTRPLLTILGVVAGVVGGGWYSYRIIMKVMGE